MSNRPLISVFIPVYNAEAFVQRTVESVLAQTFLDFELIIVNDASTDDTAAVINQFKDNLKIRIYHNPINLGVGKNWNYGVSLCFGKYFVRLDADDYFEPDYLEKVVAQLEMHREIDMVFTGVRVIEQNGKETIVLPYKDSWVRYGREFLPDLLQTCYVRSPTACVRKEVYQELGPIIEDMSIHEDWEFWVRIAASPCQIAYIAEPLVNITILNPGGCTNQSIVHARSPIACQIWLDKLANQELPYRLDSHQLTLLKQGMYDIVMTFAVFAMEAGLTKSVEQHIEFARRLLPPQANGSMQARLLARAAEVHFRNGGTEHFTGWRFLVQALRYGLLPLSYYSHLKLWGRAILGKTMFEFLREQTIARRKFPYTSPR